MHDDVRVAERVLERVQISNVAAGHGQISLAHSQGSGGPVTVQVSVGPQFEFGAQPLALKTTRTDVGNPMSVDAIVQVYVESVSDGTTSFTIVHSQSVPTPEVYGELAVAPAPRVWVGDVFLYVEVINMGTAPSHYGDTLTGSLVFDRSVFHQESVDIPPIEPDGGMWKHAFKFDGRFVMVPGESEMGVMITNVGTIGEVQDDQRAQFTVSARE